MAAFRFVLHCHVHEKGYKVVIKNKTLIHLTKKHIPDICGFSEFKTKLQN